MGTSFAKRQRERSREEKQREKAARKQQRRAEADANTPQVAPGEDPDIAGIVPGPQPRLEEDDL